MKLEPSERNIIRAEPPTDLTEEEMDELKSKIEHIKCILSRRMTDRQRKSKRKLELQLEQLEKQLEAKKSAGVVEMEYVFNTGGGWIDFSQANYITMPDGMEMQSVKMEF